MWALGSVFSAPPELRGSISGSAPHGLCSLQSPVTAGPQAQRWSSHRASSRALELQACPHGGGVEVSHLYCIYSGVLVSLSCWVLPSGVPGGLLNSAPFTALHFPGDLWVHSPVAVGADSWIRSRKCKLTPRTRNFCSVHLCQ